MTPSDSPILLHAGALGDLALTLQLALRWPAVRRAGRLTVLSRVDPGDLRGSRPAVERLSLDGLDSHALYMPAAPPGAAAGGESPGDRTRIAEIVRGRSVFSALGGPLSGPHRALVAFGARRVWSIDPVLRTDTAPPRHITRQWRADLQAQGLLLDSCAYRSSDGGALHVPDEFRAAGRAAIVAHLASDARADGKALALIHPGSGGAAKCWPRDAFIEAAARLRDFDLAPVFVLGPVELERWDATIVNALRRDFGCIPLTDARDLPRILAAAAVFIGNDSGPAHLAALLGTPTVTLFGPTDPAVWAPLGRRCAVVRGDSAADPQSWNIDSRSVARAAAQLATPSGL